MTRLAGFVGERTSVAAGPRRDLAAIPDLTHGQRNLRRGKVLTRDELLDTLAADAEHDPDLRRAHKMMPGKNHSHDTTAHLTIGQESGRLVV